MLGCFYLIPDGVTCAGGGPCLGSILVGDGGCQARRSGNLSLELTLPGAGRTLTQYLLPQGQKVLPWVFSALSDWEVGDARLVGSECSLWLPRAGWAPTQSLLVLLQGKLAPSQVVFCLWARVPEIMGCGAVPSAWRALVSCFPLFTFWSPFMSVCCVTYKVFNCA